MPYDASGLHAKGGAKLILKQMRRMNQMASILAALPDGTQADYIWDQADHRRLTELRYLRAAAVKARDDLPISPFMIPPLGDMIHAPRAHICAITRYANQLSGKAQEVREAQTKATRERNRKQLTGTDALTQGFRKLKI